MKHRKINIPIFVSHQGCPNDCIFCNQKRITGVYKKEKWDDIREKIKSYLLSAPKNCDIEISFFGGSFTGIDLNEQNLYLDIANSFFYDKRIKGIRLSTRPDYISDEILKNLKSKGVTTIELGVQSMDDDVLDLNKRGIKSRQIYESVAKVREYGFNLGLQMMTGMYGSTIKKDIYTSFELIKLKPDFVRIYPTVVIKDTELYDLYIKKEYKPYTLEKSIVLCAKLLTMFEEKNIPVIRLGLMSSDDVNEKNVYGPYHSSFRELVESYRFYKRIKDLLKGKDTFGKILHIRTINSNVSKITGNKKYNIIKLKQKYNLKDIKVITDGNSSFDIELI